MTNLAVTANKVFLDRDGISILLLKSGSGEAQLCVPSDPVALADALLAADRASKAVES